MRIIPVIFKFNVSAHFTQKIKNKNLNSWFIFCFTMKLSNILVVYTVPRSREELSALKAVKTALKENKINYRLAVREKLSKKLFPNKDLVIAVGGDGTFLIASQYISDKTLVFGVNSDPKCKEGFFMTAKKNDFKVKLRNIINNNYKIRKLHRIEAYIGNKKIPEPALNEFYVASEKPYHTARYYLTVRNKRERQKSSGILISTASGSYAWIKSAGGKKLPLQSDKFEYLIREPYYGRTAAKCALVNGILNKNEKLGIEFELGNGIIIADSIGKEYKFKSKQKVTIRLSNKPIHSVSFNSKA
jgi:NAD kinase|tara:strand:- start:10013 stop:10918 length:906 start_codon:yes stop_codon:yes gene_type:complete